MSKNIKLDNSKAVYTVYSVQGGHTEEKLRKQIAEARERLEALERVAEAARTVCDREFAKLPTTGRIHASYMLLREALDNLGKDTRST